MISAAKQQISQRQKVDNGQLKRVARQLRVENDVLTKYGRPVLPPSMRRHVIAEYHNSGHLGPEKLTKIMTSRFYWPGMAIYLKNHVSLCNICGQCKVGASPKAPLIPIYEAQLPMEFIALDIAYMPSDTDGFQYVLLIGDVFSKYVEVIPLRDQTAPSIIQGLWQHWLCRYGYPKYILTDCGSNVDGEVVNNICRQFGIEKRRTSGYHSQ